MDDQHPAGGATDPTTISADSPIAARLAELLTSRGETLAVAEGATGGLLAHLLTQVPGSSAWFRGGIVAYTDPPKQLLLRVATETLEQRGTVSPETVVQMARMARRLLGTTWSLAVVGYADDTAPVESQSPPGVPAANPPGVPRVESERYTPAAGLTFAAWSGRMPSEPTDSQFWEEWRLDAPDRATYKRHAAETALELLLKTLEGLGTSQG